MQVVVDAASHQGVAVGVLQAKEVRTADGGQHVVVVHAEEGEVVGVVDAGLGVVHQFGVAGTLFVLVNLVVEVGLGIRFLDAQLIGNTGACCLAGGGPCISMSTLMCELNRSSVSRRNLLLPGTVICLLPM